MKKHNTFRLYCVTEQAEKEIILEDPDVPTVCPTNAAHEINSDSIRIVSTLSSNVTEIMQNELIDPDQATTVQRGYNIDITSGNPVSSGIIKFPYNVDVLGGRYFYTDIEYGDYVNVCGRLAGDSPIGLLTANASSGAEYLYLSETVFGVIKLGSVICINGDDDHEYEITEIELPTGKVKVTPAITDDFSENDTVHMRHYFGRKKYVYPDSINECGLDVFRASGLPIGMEIYVRYYHKTTPSVNGKIYFNVVYRH